MQKNLAVQLLIAVVINCFLAVNLFAFSASSKQDTGYRTQYLNPSLNIQADSIENSFNIGRTASEESFPVISKEPSGLNAFYFLEVILSITIIFLVISALYGAYRGYATLITRLSSPQYQQEMAQRDLEREQNHLNKELTNAFNELKKLQIDQNQRSTAANLLSMIQAIDKHSWKITKEEAEPTELMNALKKQYPLFSLLSAKNNNAGKCLLELAKNHYKYLPEASKDIGKNFSGLLFYEDESVTMISNSKQSGSGTVKYWIALDIHEKNDHTLSGAFVGAAAGAFVGTLLDVDLIKTVAVGTIAGGMVGKTTSEDAYMNISAGVADDYFLTYGYDMDKKLIGTLPEEILRQISQGYYLPSGSMLTNVKLDAAELARKTYPHTQPEITSRLQQLNYLVHSAPIISSSI
ncbi:MAG: hypothetical protein KKD05_03380 [Candidatus Omnitrophica bacterium]|nr:hypothetical protein [Candidatus Omnitrophota bacterium]